MLVMINRKVPKATRELGLRLIFDSHYPKIK